MAMNYLVDSKMGFDALAILEYSRNLVGRGLQCFHWGIDAGTAHMRLAFHEMHA